MDSTGSREHSGVPLARLKSRADLAAWQRRLEAVSPVLYHGSATPALALLEALSRAPSVGTGRCLYATASLVLATARSLQKSLGRGSALAWVYGVRRAASWALACLSLRRDLLADWDSLEAVVYACSADGFAIVTGQRPSRVARCTLGLLDSPPEWGASRPVAPLAELHLRLTALPCRLSWHTPGEWRARTIVAGMLGTRHLPARGAPTQPA
jgi:hypothetical protein